MVGLEDLGLALSEVDGWYDDRAFEIAEPGFLAD